MELAEFLVLAKRKTYANASSSSTTLYDGSKELTFTLENFSYRDRYLGDQAFLGEEVVFKDGKAFWGMNYYGLSLTEQPSSAEIGQFLKSALSEVSQQLPFRGPLFHKIKDFEYHNQVLGTVDSFSGEEEICYLGERVYYLHYHGGLIQK